MAQCIIPRRGSPASGGFPSGWNTTASGLAAQPILKNDPIATWTSYGYEGCVQAPITFPTFYEALSAKCMHVSTNGNYIVVTGSGYPYVYILKKTGTTFAALPAGSVPNSAKAGTTPHCCYVSTTGKYVLLAYSGAPFLDILVNNGSDVYTKATVPSEITSGSNFPEGFAIAPNEASMVISTNMLYNSSSLSFYTLNGSTITRQTLPTKVPSNKTYLHAMAYSPDGAYLAVAAPDSTVNACIYKVTAGAHTFLTNFPTTYPLNTAFSKLIWSGDGTKFTCTIHAGYANTLSTCTYVYSRSGDTFSGYKTVPRATPAAPSTIFASADLSYIFAESASYEDYNYLTLYKYRTDYAAYVLVKVPRPKDMGTIRDGHWNEASGCFYILAGDPAKMWALKPSTTTPEPIVYKAYKGCPGTIGVAMQDAALGATCSVTQFPNLT